MAYELKDKSGNLVKQDGRQVFATELAGVVKGVEVDKRILRITGSDESKDRDGDIITIKGWQLDNYLKNPVFLWSHDYRSVPLGAAKKVVRRRNPNRLDFEIRFPSEGMYPFADMILGLYNEKIINASSVGFIPTKWEDIVEEASETNSQVRRRGRKFTEQELLELSGCAVPSNPNALQDSKSLSVVKELEDYLKAGGGGVPDPLKKDEVEDWLKQEIKEIEIEEESEVKIHVVPEQIEKKDDKTPIGDPGNNPPIPDVIGDDVITFTDYDEFMKPYANEHACRLNEPGKYTSFARKNCGQKSDDKCIDVIFGIKEGKSEIQALRYPKKIWSADAAKAHCSGREGSFEAAKSTCADEYEQLIQGLKQEIADKEVIIESLRIEVESYEEVLGAEGKRGAVLNSKNKKALAEAVKLIQNVLESAETPDDQSSDDLVDNTQDQPKSDSSSEDLYDTILEDKQESVQGKRGVTGKPRFNKGLLKELTQKVNELTDLLSRSE